MNMEYFVGSDIGGTFTDVVAFSKLNKKLIFGKKLTNRKDLVEGVISCLEDMQVDIATIAVLKHGTTQVINTLLEREGAPVVLVTTEGFGDVLEINRAGRAVTFDINYRRSPPLVPRERIFEIKERMAADGSVVAPLEMRELERLAKQISVSGAKAIAISLLNSYKNSTHEDRVAQFLAERFPDLYITCGSKLSKEWFEYERAVTTVANAYVGPRAVTYIDGFDRRLKKEKFQGLFYMAGSNGGVLTVQRSKEQPIALVESGPIGGCVGATVFSKRLNLNQLIAFDMGGTTAKCALIEEHAFDVQQTYYVGGYAYGFPVRTPVLDIVEVGTGGGSIAMVDDNGRLRVGPKSASSDPGPVCFGRGGKSATVTDANLVLGRIGGSEFLNGKLKLDRDAAAVALEAQIGDKLFKDGASDVDRVGSGIVALANAQMGTAIKEITIERGRDVRDFKLFVFGGGGPLHGIDLARELGIPSVIVPPEPGNFSALGMLFADARLEQSRTLLANLEAGVESKIQSYFEEIRHPIENNLRSDFDAQQMVFEYQADVRFRGQRHTLPIHMESTSSIQEIRNRFLKKYAQRYGYAEEAGTLEIVNLRVVGTALSDKPELAHLHSIDPKASGKPVGVRSVYFRSRHARIDQTPVYKRTQLPIGFRLVGPAIIEEYGSTSVIGPDDQVVVGELGELNVTLAS